MHAKANGKTNQMQKIKSTKQCTFQLLWIKLKLKLKLSCIDLSFAVQLFSCIKLYSFYSLFLLFKTLYVICFTWKHFNILIFTFCFILNWSHSLSTLKDAFPYIEMHSFILKIFCMFLKKIFSNLSLKAKGNLMFECINIILDLPTQFMFRL